MTDFTWPEDLVPFGITFYLQPHTGGTESPFSRLTKVYGLSAPRWICSMSFRGGYWGTTGLEAVGPRLDAMLIKLRGRENRVALYDFKRSRMRSPTWPRGASNLAAASGATTMTITGLPIATKVYAGDYIGGDGRPHLIVDDVTADASGQALVTFEPPLKTAVASGAAVFGNPTGIFRLVDDDAGANPVEVGETQVMSLQFVEDL